MNSIPPCTPVVLVAEDDIVNQKLLADICKAEGYDVVTADDGDRALELFRTVHVDLVLVDASMPRKSGFDVCKEIRLDSEIPVIIVTASVEPRHQAKAWKAGASGFVAKPFRIYELTQHMRAALMASRSPTEPPTITGRRTRRRQAANVLTGLPGAVSLRLRLRKEVDWTGQERACLVARLTNEPQVVQRDGRHATDAVLGSVAAALGSVLGDRDVFWAESNEIVGVMEAGKLKEAARAMQVAVGALGRLDVGDVVVRLGAVRYQATADLDIEGVLYKARAAVEAAGREGEPMTVLNLSQASGARG